MTYKPTYRSPALEALRPVVVDDLVRLGRNNDGGYVVSLRSTAGISVLLGLGINTDWSFEADFLRRSPATRLLAVDGSVSKTHFFRDALWHGTLAFIHLAKGHIADARREWATSGEYWALRRNFGEFFSQPGRVFMENMIGDVDGWTGTAWNDLAKRARALDGGNDPHWFVKMDIEGAEYRVVPEMIESAAYIDGLAMEIHECDLLSERFDEVIAQLKEHFVIVHVHANNHAPFPPGSPCPRVLELSLLNKRLVKPDELARPNLRDYPIRTLDQPNNVDSPDYMFLPRVQ